MIPLLLTALGGYFVGTTKFYDGGRVVTTLEDICDVKTEFPEADFWLQRKGSVTTIGRPTKQYNSENIGIKVKTDYKDQISAEYLFYSLQYLHQQRVFEPLAVGSLSLKNLRVSEIKSIPIARH